MSRLLLLRHGQARSLTDDYDRLSDHGRRQSRYAGRHLLAHDVAVDGAYCGTLKRQRETGEEVGSVYSASGQPWPGLTALPGLDEFPAETVIERLTPVLSAADPDIAELARAAAAHRDGHDSLRHMQRYIETVVDRWVHERFDRAAVPGLVSWAEFVDGVRTTLGQIRRDAGRGATVAVFTSGGPVAVAVQSVLAAPAATAAGLCWRVQNASLTEFTFSSSRISLDVFNNFYYIPAEHRTYR